MPNFRLDTLWDAGEVDVLFDGELRRPTPWGSARRSKVLRDYDADALAAAIDVAPNLVEVDPRDLYATQPSVIRSGVTYYLGAEYYASGRTYADYDRAVNRYPVIYRREDGQSLILSGHHRATAALLRGRSLLARVAQGGWGARRDLPPALRTRRPASDSPARWHLTPQLTVGAAPAWDHVVASSLEQAAGLVRSGNACHLQDLGAHRQVELLTRFGLSAEESQDQRRFAASGGLIGGQLRDCVGNEPGECHSYKPGHALHSIQARLLGEQPWGWRDGTVTCLEWSSDGCTIGVDYIAVPRPWAGWHHRDLTSRLRVGDPVRIHEGLSALQAGRILACIRTIEGLGTVPEPDDVELWRGEGRAVIVDVAQGLGIDVD